MKTKTTKKVSKLKASDEFKVGVHNIGWINSNFLSEFGNKEFERKAMPNFQKLPRSMNDYQIESELKPGLCELGDILAFIENAPEECKDGYCNLLYTEKFVVSVGWHSGGRGWGVDAWRRDGRGWGAGPRVFSPATGSKALSPESLGHSETMTLESAIKIVKDAGYKVYQEK